MKEPLNEQLARMQKLAGIITENQINENTKHTELKSLEDILLKNGYKFEGDDNGFSGKATYEKKINDLNTYEISLFKDYENSPVRILYFVGDDYTFTNGKKLNRGQADIRYKSINDAEKDLEGISQIKENISENDIFNNQYSVSNEAYGMMDSLVNENDYDNFIQSATNIMTTLTDNDFEPKDVFYYLYTRLTAEV